VRRLRGIESLATVVILAVLAAVAPGHAVANEADLTPLIAAIDERGISILQDSLAKPNIQLITSEGSANHALWRAFAARGWMTEGPGYGGGPVGVILKVYTLTPDGLAKIPAVLDGAKK